MRITAGGDQEGGVARAIVDEDEFPAGVEGQRVHDGGDLADEFGEALGFVVEG